MKQRPSSIGLLRSLAAAGLAASAALTGCAMGGAGSSAPASTSLPAIQGRIMGGETPIAGSKVTLWVTDPGNTGYGMPTSGGTGAQPIQTVTGSTPGGNFSFTTGYTCPAGQFVYLTSTGGDVSNGSGMTNNNVVLVAALGSCSNFANSTAQSKVNISINEVSTVAAAYALDGFTTVDASSAGNQKVYIGAPAKNNASTGACSGTGTSFSCVAAGLSHAFSNALALSDSVRFDGSFPSGTANQTVPGNTNGSVPQAVVNSLADIMQYCVNSAGGAANDGSACGNYFLNATSPSGTVVPSDTFSAMMNVARAPWNNVGSACTGTTGGLFCLLPSPAAFNPTLSTAPHDWTVAISYAGPSSTLSFGSPQWASLDANDNVYVQTGNTYSPTLTGIAGMTSTGSMIFNVPQSTAFCTNGETLPDAVGNVWMSISTSTSGGCAYGLYQFSATTGAQESFFGPASGTVCNTSAPTSANCPGFPAGGYDTTHPIQSTPKPMAFDRQGNLWYARNSSTCTSCVFEFPYTAGTGGGLGSFGGVALTEGNASNIIASSNQMIIDAAQNVWIGNASTTNGTPGNLYLIPNTGTPAAPTYTPATGFIKQPLATYDNGGLGIDSAGNVWTASQGNIYEYHPTLNGASSTFNAAVLTAQPGATTPNHPYTSEMDGLGMFFYPSLTNSGQIWYQATSLNAANFSSTAANNYGYVRPCYSPAGASTCVIGTGFYPTGDVKSLQIDSSGAIWMAAGVDSTLTQGYVVQMLGLGNPTWPLYQLGVFGTKPQ